MAEYFGDNPVDKRTRYQTIKAALIQDRSSFVAHWRELGDYLLPRRTRFWTGDRNKGDKRNQKIVDSTGRFSVRTLQSGLHAGLTSPARPWMKLTTPDPDLAKSPAVKAWLSVVTQRMLTVFQQTNLYNSLPIIYGDMGVFGTACMGMVDDTKDLFRCYPYPIGSYALGLDKRGLATAFVREYQLSVRQVIAEFGLKPDRKTIDWSKLSISVKNCWEKAQYEEPVDLTWLVLPNPYPKPGSPWARDKPWVSCHWEDKCAEGKFLRESGFTTFPILAPRWDITGEDTYGTDCPGMTALPDIKQLQEMQRAKALAIQKMIKPALQAPVALMTQKVSSLPDDVTYVDVPSGFQGVRALHEVTLNIEHFVMDIERTQQRIQRAFFEDLFLMLAQAEASAQPITAEEVRERHEEKLLALGPVLERSSDELLEPLVDRAYLMMEDAGLIPEPPEELQGVTIKAEYTSILAQAQKMVGVSSVDRFVGATSNLITTVAPGARHKVDYNRVIDVYADALGVDPSIVRTNEDADELANQEAQAQQRDAEAKQAQQMAAAMHSAGTTPMDGDTALTRLVGKQPQPGAAA